MAEKLLTLVRDKNKDGLVTLISDQGEKQDFQEVFTFASDQHGKSYILLTALEEDAEILAFAFADTESWQEQEADLFEIESEEEWQMVEDVMTTILNGENL